MTTLYLSPRHTEDAQLLWKAAIKLDWNIQRLSWSLLDGLSSGEVKNRVIYGETSFVNIAAEKLKIDLLGPRDTFLHDLDWSFTKRKIWHFHYGANGFNSSNDNDPTNRNDWNILDWYNLKGPIFVKPVEKGLFPAKVYENPVSEIRHLPDRAQVIVSEPVDWDVEFRAFIFGRKVKTISPYSRKGEFVEQASAKEWEEAEAFANQVAKYCDFAGVVDVGYIIDRGWAVVEGNGAWGSGIYGCDPIEALKVIKEACRNL